MENSLSELKLFDFRQLFFGFQRKILYRQTLNKNRLQTLLNRQFVLIENCAHVQSFSMLKIWYKVKKNIGDEL